MGAPLLNTPWAFKLDVRAAGAALDICGVSLAKAWKIPSAGRVDLCGGVRAIRFSRLVIQGKPEPEWVRKPRSR